MELINKQTVIEKIVKDEKFHRSHGARDDFLGTGLLYYTLTYMHQAKLAVCLGSGSGFVPRLMRQAQKDLGIEGKTVLVDANISGWGDADYFEEPTFFTKNFDVEIVQKTTQEAASMFKEIDYLHIDADHSYEAAKQDLETYSKLMSERSVITMHDTILRKCGVWKVLEEAREEFDLVNLHLGMGVAILVRRENA